MKVTLVNPLSEESEGAPQVHMSLLYLGTALDREGHDVTIIDSQVHDAKRELSRSLAHTDCVGISAMTVHVKSALELSDQVKEADQSIPLVWGGPHATLFSQQTVSDKSVDYVIRGEGEKAFIALLEHLQGKRKIGTVPGLCHKGGGKVVQNPQASFIDLNELSPPSWHLMDMEKYTSDFVVGGENFGRHLPIHTARGCPYRCAFCINTSLEKKGWRPLSADNIISEMKILKEKYGIKCSTLVDENFFLDKKRAEEFAGRAISEKLDISWYANCRASYLVNGHVSKELLSLSRKSGCCVIAMGIESGSQRVLDLIKKDTKVDDAAGAVGALRDSGIVPICSFMMGIPGETKEDSVKTLQLISRLKRINPRTVIIGPQIFRPYPGCELYDSIKGLIKEPSTLREWTQTETMSGFFSPKYFPWIKDPQYLIDLSFYMSVMYSESPSRLLNAAKVPLKKLAAFRIRHSMMGLPLDRMAFTQGRRLYYALKR